MYVVFLRLQLILYSSKISILYGVDKFYLQRWTIDVVWHALDAL